MVNLGIDGYPEVIFEWCLFAVCTILVAIRLYVQLRFRSRPWRELWVIAAWSSYLGYTICDSIMNDLDWYNYTFDWEDVTDASVAPVMKMLYAESWLYKEILYFCKAALLCLYMDIAPRHCFPVLWWSIPITWVLVVIGMIFQVVQNLAPCHPISENWTWSVWFECQINYWTWAIASWTLHLLTDVLVYVVPVFILFKLENITSKQKTGAFALFALGFFNIASAVSLMVYFVFPEDADLPQGYSWAQNFLVPFQAGSAIMIICMPYCRRLWLGTSAETLRPELKDVEAATLTTSPTKMTEVSVQVGEKIDSTESSH